MAAKPNQSDFSILACLIQIWDVAGTNDKLEEPDAPNIVLAEVEEIEIVDSYKKLFNSATVKFPRGTVIRKTVTTVSEDLPEVTAKVEDDGVVSVTRSTSSSRAKTTDFHIGQRIRIRLGYLHQVGENSAADIAYTAKASSSGKTIYNDTETLNTFKQSMAPEGGSALMFDGYITKVSIDEPIILKCEDLASVLKKVTCPKIKTKKDSTVQDLFSEDGEWQLLKNTGLKLYPQNYEITIGETTITDDFTIADVLTTWAKKWRLYSFVLTSGDTPYLAIGRSYFSNIGKDSILKMLDGETVKDIQFDYNVADNGLTLMDVDKNFVAVDAQSWENIEGSKGKQYHITVRRNPQYDPEKDGEDNKYQILNETTISKKAMKAGATPLTKTHDKVDLSTYHIIPYASSKIGISHEDLQVEAIKFLESYNANGIEGTLTIFGDFNLRSGRKVHLTDNRFSVKNGYYFIDEVTTKFGTGGYRQTLKLPYCISRDQKEQKN